jgi:hypothetical protein
MVAQRRAARNPFPVVQQVFVFIVVKGLNKILFRCGMGQSYAGQLALPIVSEPLAEMGELLTEGSE